MQLDVERLEVLFVGIRLVDVVLRVGFVVLILGGIGFRFILRTLFLLEDRLNFRRYRTFSISRCCVGRCPLCRRRRGLIGIGVLYTLLSRAVSNAAPDSCT